MANRPASGGQFTVSIRQWRGETVVLIVAEVPKRKKQGYALEPVYAQQLGQALLDAARGALGVTSTTVH